MTDPDNSLIDPPTGIPEIPDDLETQIGDTLAIIVAKAEIRGAMAAFQGLDDLIGECLNLAMEHELHDDLIAGLTALSEDLRLHVRDNILPLRRRLQ